MFTVKQKAVLKCKQKALESRQESTERAIYALVTMRNKFGDTVDSKSLLDDWVAEDQRLQIKIHNYDEFLTM